MVLSEFFGVTTANGVGARRYGKSWGGAGSWRTKALKTHENCSKCSCLRFLWVVLLRAIALALAEDAKFQSFGLSL